MAALNVDTQFAVRKCVFLIRLLALPDKVTIKAAIDTLEERLTLLREEYNFGRPWSYIQLRKIYWTKAKRFIRRPVHPMTPAEWKTYIPTVTAEQIVELRRQYRASQERKKAREG